MKSQLNELKDAARGAIQAKGDLDAIKDNQLKSSIELLKSWDVYDNLKLTHIEGL
jgi:hypothetical protein